MKYTGYCLWADDVPSIERPHYIVIASDEVNGMVVVVPISSIKENKYYDEACTINIGDITDEKGKNLIVKPSFIRYQWSQDVSVSDIAKKQIMRHYNYKAKISDELLSKIQKGALESKEIPERLKAYFLK